MCECVRKGWDGVMFMSSHMYDVALTGKTVKNVALVTDWLATIHIQTLKFRENFNRQH